MAHVQRSIIQRSISNNHRNQNIITFGLFHDENSHITYNIGKNGLESQDLEKLVRNILSESMFPKLNFHVSYLAKFTKNVNGEQHSFHKWVKLDINYIHMNQDYANIHNTLMHQLDEQALEGSGFPCLRFVVIIEMYKINGIQCFSYNDSYKI